MQNQSRDTQEIPHINERTLDNPSVLTLCLLNTQSLIKHTSDLKCNFELLKSDLLALSETQLLPDDNDMEIRHNLTSLTICRHDHDCDKFSSLAICIKNNIHIRYQQYVQALNAVNFVVKFGNSTLQKKSVFSFSVPDKLFKHSTTCIWHWIFPKYTQY